MSRSDNHENASLEVYYLVTHVMMRSRSGAAIAVARCKNVQSAMQQSEMVSSSNCSSLRLQKMQINRAYSKRGTWRLPPPRLLRQPVLRRPQSSSSTLRLSRALYVYNINVIYYLRSNTQICNPNRRLNYGWMQKSYGALFLNVMYCSQHNQKNSFNLMVKIKDTKSKSYANKMITGLIDG